MTAVHSITVYWTAERKPGIKEFMKGAFRFVAAAAAVVALFLPCWVNACPECNIYNYLADSVQSSKNIFKGRVIRQIDEQTAEVEVMEVLRGKYAVGAKIRFKIPDAKEDIGKQYLLSDPTSWPPTFEILPLEFKDEILFLVQATPSVGNIEEAIKRVQGVSVSTQELGMNYLTAHHDAAVGPLIGKLNSLMPRVFSGDEVFFGEHRLGMLLKALFSNGSDQARTFAFSYIDALPKIKQDRVNWASIPSSSTPRGVFLRDLLTHSQQDRICADSLRERLLVVCPRLSGQTLAETSYAMLVSGTGTPDEILKFAGERDANDMVALGLLFAGNYESNWWQFKQAYDFWERGLAQTGQKKLRKIIAKRIAESERFMPREPNKAAAGAARKPIEPKR